jgi:hypothetical protein
MPQRNNHRCAAIDEPSSRALRELCARVFPLSTKAVDKFVDCH